MGIRAVNFQTLGDGCRRSLFGCALAWLAVASTAVAAPPPGSSIPITHVIMILQENRSFDSYFGTFPGARGLPPGTCVPLQVKHPHQGCVVPFHDPHDVNAAGPHAAPDAQDDLDDGITYEKMDGFVDAQQQSYAATCQHDPTNCQAEQDGAARDDVMGYHDAAELPNYWEYARNFVLQDQLFQPVRSWSLPSHLYLTSEWSAVCTDDTDASTCTTNPIMPGPGSNGLHPWANLFQLLDVNAVSWKYYQGTGSEPDCNDAMMTCAPQITTAAVTGGWDPPPYFIWVKHQGAAYLAAHNPYFDQFLIDLKQGTLPQVSWVAPAGVYSEHPTNGITAGMEYVTSLVNAVMQSPYWANTAIFLAWDDWGGFYDHAVPPNVDRNGTTNPIQGYGLRVPGLLISAYARPGYIDHSVLSFDAYATFFEDLFVGGARLDPVALGNPDSRPDIRDALTSVTFPDGSAAPIGKLIDEFDFTQTPRPPLVLSTHIPVHIDTTCRGSTTDFRQACTQPTVTIGWNPVTGPQVPGPFTYHVTRDGIELPQCLGSASFCTDTPPSGAHLYRAYSVDGAGVASPTSAASEADMP